MDQHPYRNPGGYAYNTGTSNYGYMIDYDYRYNNLDAPNYGYVAGSEYRRDSLTRSPAYTPIFSEAANYRLYDPAGTAFKLWPKPASTPGAWAFKWPHFDGGNVLRTDGGVQWLANQIDPTRGNFYGNGTSWPSGNNFLFYYYGASSGLDYYMKQRG
jgi:hypothetical protein